MDSPAPVVLVEAACPLCQSNASKARKLRGYSLHVCGGCGHWFVPLDDQLGHVGRTYGDQYFAGDPGGYVDYLGEERQQRRSGKFYARLLAGRGAHPGVALDVGCAAGFHAMEFIQQGWQVEGIEPNAWMAEHARERGVTVVGGDVATWQPTRTYDAVLMVQVISHLQDPAGTIQRVAESVRSGGWLIVETWDRDAWIARLQGDGWHELNPPSVLHWFSRSSLASLLRQNGLEVVSRGLPPKRIAIARGAGMISHTAGDRWWSRLATAPLRWLPKNLAVPYWLGDAFWILAKKNG
jgi:SAM-dependent methyltransferase